MNKGSFLGSAGIRNSGGKTRSFLTRMLKDKDLNCPKTSDPMVRNTAQIGSMPGLTIPMPVQHLLGTMQQDTSRK